MIRKNLIYINNVLENRSDIIQKMSMDAKKDGLLTDVEQFVQAVLQREEEIPTTVGFNVCIPHGKSSSVLAPFIMFMKTKNAFIWDKSNKEEVQLIFMIGVPTDQKDKLHLKILAQISKRLLDPSFRMSLLKAESIDEVYQLLKSIEETIYAEEMGNVK